MRILFVASEGLPFSKTGGLADVIEALSRSIAELGHEVAVLLPRYRDAPVLAVASQKVTVSMGDGPRFPVIASGGALHGVRYYFVDDPEYFDRDQLYDVAGKDYPDNAERFAEFGRAAIEFCKHVWMPEVIHCHDWQSGLVPVLLRTQYAKDDSMQGVPVVFTIHNMGFHGAFPRDGSHYTRVETRATCSQCGKETTVPFRPTQGRPIFCRECFTQKRNVATA